MDFGKEKGEMECEEEGTAALAILAALAPVSCIGRRHPFSSKTF